MLNDYDKNFVEKNKKFFLKSINLRNEDKNILNENYLVTNGPVTGAASDENKRSRNINVPKIIKENNISYFESYFENKNEKVKKNKAEMYMEKTVMTTLSWLLYSAATTLAYTLITISAGRRSAGKWPLQRLMATTSSLKLTESLQ